MERQRTQGSRWNFFIYTAGGSLPELLERDEAGGVGGTDARPAVLHRLVRDGKLAQVVADHLGLQVERSMLGTELGDTGTSPSHPRAARSLAQLVMPALLLPWCLDGLPQLCPSWGGDTGATGAFVPFQVGFNTR